MRTNEVAEQRIREEAQADRKYRLRWWTLAALSVSLLIVIIDDTIINVAVPTLQRELGASASGLQWIVDSYVLVFAGLLLTMGTLGDRFGRRRFLELGLVVFGASSVFAAYAGSTAELIVARSLMGVGGALIMPSTLSVIIDVFPRDERVKAIGIWTGIASLGIPLGPVVGGWLLEQYWWGAVFLLNIPIVVVALVAVRAVVPESRHPSPPRADIAGMALSTAALAALVYAIIEAPGAGWSNAKVVAGFATALSSTIAFVYHEQRVEHPMLELRLFRNARLSWGTVAITVAALALAGLAFELTQYLQFAQGYTPLAAGLRVVPLALGFGVAGPASQRLVRRLGTGTTVALGLGTVAVVLVALAQVEATTGFWLVGPAIFLVGAGIGTAFVPSTDAVMSAVPERDAGLGSAINDASRQVGAALGIGILGSIANGAYTSRIAQPARAFGPGVTAVAKQSVAAALQVADRIGGSAGKAFGRAATAAFTDGFGIAMLAAAGVVAVGAVLVRHRLPAHDTPPVVDDGSDIVALEALSPTGS
jgi:EmrB/QacA subfamily drug resistance transporter